LYKMWTPYFTSYDSLEPRFMSRFPSISESSSDLSETTSQSENRIPDVLNNNVLEQLPDVFMKQDAGDNTTKLAEELEKFTLDQNSNEQSRGDFKSIHPKLRLSSSCDARFERLQEVAKLCNSKNHQKGMIDFEQLRRDSWLGISGKLRPLIWRLLSGYIPASLDEKRNEYWQFAEEYFHTDCYEKNQETFRQIQLDVPRMSSLTPLFKQKIVQRIFERVLYIWSVRNPEFEYAQGMNDLLTPFFVVFLSEFVPENTEIEKFDVSQLVKEEIEIIEVDSFWCFNSLLDTIQDNYTFDQPGIQHKIGELEYLLTRLDDDLTCHFRDHQIEIFLFAFRWMNNILMREIPLSATIRLWDTYLSELNGFSEFHVYVCTAFLRLWSKQLLLENDLQGIMSLLQNLPTQDWDDKNISELTADAYRLMRLFHGAKRLIYNIET